MCDYSLQHVKSRDAVIGDKLITLNFGMGTVGFKGEDTVGTGETPIAVCIRPGTELGFAEPIKLRKRVTDGWAMISDPPQTTEFAAAIFRQVNKEIAHVHHDTLEFPDGSTVLLDYLAEFQHAHVLQLPAEPKNEAEVQEQTRCEFVG